MLPLRKLAIMCNGAGTYSQRSHTLCPLRLAVCGFTHYAWITRRLRGVNVSGPTHAIRARIDLSNAAATTRLTDEQLETLRRAFGMYAWLTTADRTCISRERCFFWGGYTARVLSACSTCHEQHSGPRSTVAVGCC